MPVTLRDPQDLDLRAYRRIAWDGEGVELDPGALERIAERRAAFDAFVAANEGERLYGVTTAHHRGASTLLSPAARIAYARRVPAVPATFGPSLPERLVRGIVAARLSGFIGGGSAVRPELALAVAAMLAGPMPRVPARGHGDPGEIIALGATFAHLEDVVALEAKEGMALVNGAPCAAAALADAALGARGRLAVLEKAVALALEAARAPHAHLDPALDGGWRDPHEAASLGRLRALLEDGADQSVDPIRWRWRFETRPASSAGSAVSFSRPRSALRSRSPRPGTIRRSRRRMPRRPRACSRTRGTTTRARRPR